MGRFENHKVGDINGNPNKRTIRRPTGGRYILAYAKKLNDYFKKYIIGGYFKRITKNRNSVSNIRQDMGL